MIAHQDQSRSLASEEQESADSTLEYEEIEHTEDTGNLDTLLTAKHFTSEVAKVLEFAPCEGNIPLSFFQDSDSEYLAFPTIFGGQRRLENEKRIVRVTYGTVCKWELRSCDRRCAKNIANIFYKFRKLQTKQICDKASISLRRVQAASNRLTAGEVKSAEARQKLVKLDDGYRIFRTLRTTPPYWDTFKKDVFAMVRQLGLPTFFMTFSSADTQWKVFCRLYTRPIWAKSCQIMRLNKWIG